MSLPSLHSALSTVLKLTKNHEKSSVRVSPKMPRKAALGTIRCVGLATILREALTGLLGCVHQQLALQVS
jgi:hypothetical protein